MYNFNRSITGCLSYLVNMMRQDLAFAHSQLSKFVQYPGIVHLESVDRVLQYVRTTYDTESRIVTQAL